MVFSRTPPLYCKINSEFRGLQSREVRRCLDIGLIHITLKSVIIELWKCSKLPPILRSVVDLSALND